MEAVMNAVASEMAEMKGTYKRTQIGWSVFIWAVTLPAIAIYLFMWLTDMPRIPFVLTGIFFALLLGFAYLMSNLTVEVTEEAVRFHFGFDFFKREVPLRSIRSIEIMQLPWYYGYGMRITTDGRIYRVSGAPVVRLRLANGKSVYVGSDEPEKLKTVVKRNTELWGR